MRFAFSCFLRPWNITFVYFNIIQIMIIQMINIDENDLMYRQGRAKVFCCPGQVYDNDAP